jgi:hypothetical protein
MTSRALPHAAGMMLAAGTLLLALAPHAASAAPTSAPLAQKGTSRPEITPAPLLDASPAYLPVLMRCSACVDATPTASLLWRAEADKTGREATSTMTLAAKDWSAGTFSLTGRGLDLVLTGSPLPSGGWAIDVPMPPEGLPFRVVGALEGFVAGKAVYWPQGERTQVVFDMQPLGQVLDQHPAWNPSSSAECEVVVPKSAATPIVFEQDGKPCAWLFPTLKPQGPDDAWTFQFVKPGASLMERVSVRLPAFPEGDTLSFRLPLSGVLAPSSAKSAADATAPITMRGGGTIDLADCPRVAR